MTKLYKNFFEWYKETQDKWQKKTHSIYPDGIDDEMFVYFIEMYLYDGDKNLNRLNKLKYILKKYSKRYRREHFLIYNLHREYTYHRKDSYLDEHCFHHKMRFDDFYNKKYKNEILPNISDKDFVNYILDYDLIEPIIFSDPLGCTQINLWYCENILHKHSLRFKLEEFLYKKFK